MGTNGCVLYVNFPYSRLQEVRMNQQIWMYPGSTKKSALAQNERLEFNNKEFSNFPSVRTLEGMSRQGNYIGICNNANNSCTFAGAITERAVYQSGNGAKGNKQMEWKLFMKVGIESPHIIFWI